MNATTRSMSCSMSMPGGLLEFLLALVVVLAGHRGVQLLAELRLHHVLDVGVGDEDGVGGHVLQFGWALGLPECPHGHSCVIRDEPRAQPDEQHRHRAEHEVAGPLWSFEARPLSSYTGAGESQFRNSPQIIAPGRIPGVRPPARPAPGTPPQSPPASGRACTGPTLSLKNDCSIDSRFSWGMVWGTRPWV